MSEFLDSRAEATGTSFATWQDRQLAVILARTEQLLRELRSTAWESGGRSEELSRELGRLKVLLEAREAELRQSARKAATLSRQLEEQTTIQAALRVSEQKLQEEVARLRAAEKNYADENQALSWKANASSLEAAN